MAALLCDYDTALDDKHRITVKRVKGATKIYKNYHIYLYDDGSFLCKPRVLVDPALISDRTLKMMDSAMKNFAKGVRSEPIDLPQTGSIGVMAR